MPEESRRQRARRLWRMSWDVVRADRRLLTFTMVAVAATFLLGAVCLGVSTSVVGGTEHTRRVIALTAVVLSYPSTFVTYCCGVALAAVLDRRLSGQPATAADGWRAARERLGVIAGWTLLTCTVGALLRLLEEYVPLGGRIVVWLVGLAWSLATLLAVPVLAHEGLGPIATARRSAALFRERWAEQTLGTVGIGAGFGLASIPFLLLLGIGLAAGGAGGIVTAALGGAGLFAIGAFATAMDLVFRVFVYRSAVGLDDGSEAPYLRADLERPFIPAKRRRLRGATT